MRQNSPSRVTVRCTDTNGGAQTVYISSTDDGRICAQRAHGATLHVSPAGALRLVEAISTHARWLLRQHAETKPKRVAIPCATAAGEDQVVHIESDHETVLVLRQGAGIPGVTLALPPVAAARVIGGLAAHIAWALPRWSR